MTTKYSKKDYKPRPKQAIRKLVLERDNYICQLCGEPTNSIDHIIPLVISHDNSIGNLRALCLKCNNKRRQDARPSLNELFKSAKDELENSEKPQTDIT